MIAAVLLALTAAEGRSLYVWSEAKAIAESRDDGRDLLRFCSDHRISRLYFMFTGAGTPGLRVFVRGARNGGVEVHALRPGDMAEWLDAFPARFDHEAILSWVRAAVKYNREGAPEERFGGIHLDVEPHATPHWKTHRLKLAAGYLELVRRARDEAKGLHAGAAVPWNWDRGNLRLEAAGRTKTLIGHVLDRLDSISIMAYRGRNVASVLEAIEGECAAAPGRVELILETDRSVVEEGVPLHVGDRTRMEEIFRAARKRFGPNLRNAVHHYTTYRRLP